MSKILDGAANSVTSSDYVSRKNDLHLIVAGTFDSGTVTLQVKDIEGTYHDVTDGAFTSAAQKILRGRRGATYRAVTSGGGGSMAVDLWLNERDT